MAILSVCSFVVCFSCSLRISRSCGHIYFCLIRPRTDDLLHFCSHYVSAIGVSVCRPLGWPLTCCFAVLHPHTADVLYSCLSHLITMIDVKLFAFSFLSPGISLLILFPICRIGVYLIAANPLPFTVDTCDDARAVLQHKIFPCCRFDDRRTMRAGVCSCSLVQVVNAVVEHAVASASLDGTRDICSALLFNLSTQVMLNNFTPRTNVVKRSV